MMIMPSFLTGESIINLIHPWGQLFEMPDDRLHVNWTVVEVYQSGVHDVVDVFTDELDLLGVTVLLIDLQSGDDEAYFVDVLEDVWLEIPIVQDESEVILNFDLVS